MRVGEAGALEIGHRVGLAPDDVVEDPEPQILKDAADAEDVVIAADHPQRTVGLEHAARLGQPLAGEAVIGRHGIELVPVIGHRIDMTAVRAIEIAAELEVVGWIGEDEIDAGRRQRAHGLDAVAGQDTTQRKIGCTHHFDRFFNDLCARLHLLYDTHWTDPAVLASNLSTGMSP